MAARDDRTTIKRSGLTAVDRCPDGLASEWRPRWCAAGPGEGCGVHGHRVGGHLVGVTGSHPVERPLALVGLLGRFDIALNREALLPPCVRSRHHILRGNPRRQRRGNGSIGRTVEHGRSPKLPPRHDAASVADLPYPDDRADRRRGARRRRRRRQRRRARTRCSPGSVSGATEWSVRAPRLGDRVAITIRRLPGPRCDPGRRPDRHDGARRARRRGSLLWARPRLVFDTARTPVLKESA